MSTTKKDEAKTDGAKSNGAPKKKKGTRKPQTVKVLRYVGANDEGKHLWEFPPQPIHTSIPQARDWAMKEFQGEAYAEQETFSIVKAVGTYRTKKVQVTQTTVEECTAP